MPSGLGHFYTLQGTRVEPFASGRSHLQATVSQVLSKFMPDPQAFRELMRNTGSVISGSTALYLVCASPPWFPNDVDLYVTFDEFHPVVKALQEEQGAAIVDPAQLHARYEGAEGICGFVRLRTDRGHIEVIRSSSDSALYPVALFWTTLLMNVVAADFVCIPYPELTMRGRGLVEFREYSDKETLALAKYAQRGFEFRRSAAGWEDTTDMKNAGCFEWSCVNRARYFGDGGCLIAIFDGYVL